MQVRSLWILFDSPFEADEVRRVLSRTGNLNLLKIEQTTTTSLPSQGVRPKPRSDEREPVHKAHLREVQEALGALVGMTIPALYAGSSAKGMICIVSDRHTSSNLIRTLNGTLPPGSSVLVLQSRNEPAIKKPSASAPCVEMAYNTSQQSLSRDDLERFLDDHDARTRKAKAS